MSNIDTSYLRQFEKNDFMLWSVCSQTIQTFKVIIQDDKKIYATISKNMSEHNLVKLSQESAFYEGGNNLRIEVQFDDKKVNIKKSQTAGTIMDTQSNTVGFSYTFCMEDGTDDDYNDVYITIIAWKKKG